MFENLQRELRRLADTQELSVPLASDEEGYWDKECPAEACLFQFKVLAEDWKGMEAHEEVFCPSCRHTAGPRSWFTTEQIEQARQHAMSQVKSRLNGAMRADAAASQRRQRSGSFLRMTLDVKGFPVTSLVPVAAAEPMRLRASCDSCGCRYSYVGAAYFCPSCGRNSADHTFAQTLSTIRTAAGLGATLRQTLSPDDAEVMMRALLEKAIQDAVMSFQRLAEQLYEVRTGAAARRNAFQNLDEGSKLWKAAIGATYTQLLGEVEIARLRVFFQQRHLLAHCEGIVDADYITRSGDVLYAVGQRLVIREPAVLEFADLVERLGTALSARCNSRGGQL